jgi:hypothetical protein
LLNIAVTNKNIEDWSRTYDGEKANAFFCDPPYLIGWMQQKWDIVKNADEAISRAQSWGECIIPHLYPGALGFMFASPRAQHYIALGMEKAGFRIWDTLTMFYMFGTGFPKSQSIESMTGDSNWSGRKTASLKPSYESILAFQAPTDGLTYAELAMKYGTGTLNIDGARIPIEDDVNFNAVQRQSSNTAGMNGIGKSGFKDDHVQDMYNEKGRFPSNIVFDEESSKYLDDRFDGFPSRFFYTTKSSQKERESGLDNFKLENGRRNTHSAVKPIDMCKYFSTLLIPPESIPNSTLLVPFSGSGSEIIGSMLAGWRNIVGFDEISYYCDIARSRIDWWKDNSNDTKDVKEILRKADKPKEEVAFSLF